MLKNLEEARIKKNITLVDIADALGIRYQTVRDKIDGIYEFKFGEALIIQEKFFPEYDIKFLFEHSNELQTVWWLIKLFRKDDEHGINQNHNKRKRRAISKR